MGGALLRIVGVFFGVTINQGLKLGLSDGEFGSRLEFDEGHPVIVWVGGGHGGQIDVGVPPREARWNNTNDGVKLMVEFEALADDIAITLELTLPEQIA